MRKLEINLDAGILKIDGKDLKEKPVVVTLPGPEGWPFARLFNAEQATGVPGECDELSVSYTEANSKP